MCSQHAKVKKQLRLSDDDAEEEWHAHIYCACVLAAFPPCQDIYGAILNSPTAETQKFSDSCKQLSLFQPEKKCKRDN